MIIHSSNTDNNNNNLPLDNVNDLPLDNWERMGTRSNQHCGSRCPGEEHQAISTHSADKIEILISLDYVTSLVPTYGICRQPIMMIQ